MGVKDRQLINRIKFLQVKEVHKKKVYRIFYVVGMEYNKSNKLKINPLSW